MFVSKFLKNNKIFIKNKFCFYYFNNFSNRIRPYRDYKNDSDNEEINTIIKSDNLQNYNDQDIESLINDLKKENLPRKILEKNGVKTQELLKYDPVGKEYPDDNIYGKRVAEFEFFPHTFTRGYDAPSWMEMYAAAKFWAFGMHAQEIYKFEKNELYFDFVYILIIGNC